MGDQNGVDAIVLGPPKLERAKGPHLVGLEHDDLETRGAQCVDDFDLVAPACLETDALHPLALKKCGQLRAPAVRVVAANGVLPPIHSAIELRLADIDPCANNAACAIFLHLVTAKHPLLFGGCGACGEAAAGTKVNRIANERESTKAVRAM